MSVVTIEQFDKVTLFTINRPEKHNAICKDTALALQQGFEEFDLSDQRVAVITGAGEKAFSAGADVTNLPELWRCIPTVGIQTEKPIIAATAGWVVGGSMVMHMMCDLAIAADNTRFSYPEAKLGFTGGMIAGLAARIPHKVAMDVILCGEILDAQRAYEAGLVNQVVPLGQQVGIALEKARKLSKASPLVLKTLKRFITRDVLPQGPSELMARTIRELSIVRESDDQKEGVQAFREKREPVYSGN
ncbi:enoyl-CoA hydratase/isomerase family protein [Advenella sp. WQ 585]|uniref:Enoyl-CoA hydratase/isomerase family protein n=1 Tax=Advenella mandrilli TaxID=2800330 RepID=A0ABS1E9P1_9BURK|nr:enoyl-CoA hydratase-related protein [Advenella mandrilli]MBK1780204.1 enoyl-CoA hydratase/isomerase family protein [Advenella mandrilli]